MNHNSQPDNSNSKPNRQRDPSEQQDAQRFVEALETPEENIDRLSPEDQAAFQLGQALRKSAQEDLPPRSESLHQKLIARLDREVRTMAPIKKTKDEPMKSNPIARYALAACLFLAIGLAVTLAAVQPHWLQIAESDVSFQPTTEPEIQRAAGTKQDRTNEDVQGRKYDDYRADAPLVAKIERTTDDAGKATDGKRQADPQASNEAKSTDGVTMFNGGQSTTITPQPSPRATSPAPKTRFSGPGGATANRPTTELARTGRVAGDVGGAVPGAGGGIGGLGRGGGGLGGGGGGRPTNSSNHFYAEPSASKKAGDGYGLYREYGVDSDDVGRYEHRARFHRIRRPDASNESYDTIIENEFKKVAGENALSTFSIDVDTASYANMRRFLQRGQRPPRNSIRIEELVNYFSYDYPDPTDETPFSVNMEMTQCPWNEEHQLLRVGLKGKDVHRDERSPSNLVFLLDVSGSMQNADKLPLLKQGLTMLVQRLSENDSVSIVTYAGNAGVVLNPTSGDQKRMIEKAIETLAAGGSTNGSAGIELAYELAQKHFIRKGSNRVILATDGDLNVGVTQDGALVKLIKEKASEGVFLTVLGFGTGNLKDSKLEKLADNGNGMYAYIDSAREAHKVLIEQMSGSLETIAKDVKIQIEFNPGEVTAYRLIGYENRILAAQDFDNDQKDAGEIGAGHRVTALYEVVLAGGAPAATASQQTLKYQPKTQPEQDSDADRDSAVADPNLKGELLTLALRYKQPDGQQSRRIEFTLKDQPKSFSSASADFRFAASVASFGMILRESRFRGNTSLKWVEETASRALGSDVGGYRSEFLGLIRQAASVR